MDSLSFPSGVGTPVLRDASSATMNNATTAKSPVTPGSGLVVLAATEGPRQYWHLDAPLAA